MVFESLVVDLLNRFIGDYVENLDRSQLKIGIWGGDVVLKNLEVKQSALDDLNLPVKIVSGHLGNLTLKIPWKSLYSSPVIASIDGLYVVVIPNSSVKYDEEKERKAKQESKQKELVRIETAKENEANKGKPDKKPDGFGEKMAMQIVKNLQVKVKNIHIRFEDTFTNQERPFAFGVTLSELAFQTTNENWKACVLGESAKMIHKLVSLNCLSSYWNSNVKCYSKLSKEDCQKALIEDIAANGFIPDNISYLLGPINSTAQLQINPKPENDGSNYSIPKILLNVVMEELAIGISKYQYQDILELLQSFERMNCASRYRKYRPNLPRKGHSKDWWKFGLNCILGEDIQRKKNNWSWPRMKYHRELCRKYKDAYKTKLTNKKAPKTTQAVIDECELQLDLFNLTIMRRQSEVEVEREGLLAKQEKANNGWFGGWLGKGKKPKGGNESNKDFVKQFEDAMTAEEKNKLFAAIDYQENSTPTIYPKDFVENQFSFMLKNLAVSIKDDSQKKSMVMKLQLKDVYSLIKQRPSDDAVSVKAQIDNMEVFGRPTSEGEAPQMIKSLKSASETENLLDINFETNPLDRSCDQRVHIAANPLQIIYDAATVNQLASVFKPPESIVLTELQAAAMNKFQDLKNMSATGLQHAIEQHKYLDLKVQLKSSFVVIPEFGVYKRNGHILVLDLGDIGIHSIKRESNKTNVNQLVRGGSTEGEVLNILKSQAFDRFNLSIRHVQILLAAPGEDWNSCRKNGDSDLHILKPTDLLIDLYKCIIPDNPSLPKMKVTGSLPNMEINISDEKLMQLAQLGLSIPIPQTDEPSITDPKPLVNIDFSDGSNLISKVDVADVLKLDQKPNKKEREEVVQMTDLELDFEIKMFAVNISTIKDGKISPLMNFQIYNLGTKVEMRTFELKANLYLGGISLHHLQFSGGDGNPLSLINTGQSGSQHLLYISFIQVNKDSPDFIKKYSSTLQHLDVTFNQLNVVLHQDAILNVMNFASELTSRLESLQGDKPELVSPDVIVDQASVNKESAKVQKKKSTDDIIDLKLVAKLDVIYVSICSTEKTISTMKVGGVEASVILSKAITQVNASLKDIVVEDPTPDVMYSQIVSSSESQLVDANVVIYNNATENEKFMNMDAVDMSVMVVLGCVKVVFVNKFVMDLLAFLDNFQVAKEKVASASAAAAEAAKHSVESAYEQASRVRLDITVNAPVIYIPQSSTHVDALVANLGVLTMKNKFETAGKRNELGIPAVLDKLSLELQDLKLSRAILDSSNKEVLTECHLLDPVTFKVTVNRNMSFNWYKDLPEVDASANFSPIMLRLSQEDFTMTMNVLNENLNEGGSSNASSDGASKNAVTSSESEKDAAKQEKEKKYETEVLNQKICNKVKFSFFINQIGILLYNGSSSLNAGLVERDPKKALASFQLQMFAMKGEVKTNNSLWVNIILVNIILDDMRSISSSVITRYVERKDTTSEGNDRSMVDITFNQDESEDKLLDMKVSSFSLIVCMDHMMAIANFFLKGMPSGDQKQVISKPRTASTSETSSSKVEPVKPTSNTTVMLKVEKPDIIFIESANDINTNAILTNLEMVMRLRITPDTQKISAQIGNLQMIMCCFNPEKRTDSIQKILSPLSISFNLNAPFGEGQNIDLSFTEVYLHVSPYVIAVLTSISSSISANNGDEPSISPEKVIRYENIWSSKLIKDCNFWFLKPIIQEAEKVPEVQEVCVGLPEDKISEKLIINMDTIILIVEANVGSQTVPMILLDANLKAEVENWTSDLFVSSTLAVKIGYYNEKKASWEYLIEPVDLKNAQKPWEISLEVSKNAVDPVDSSDEGDSISIPSLPPSAMVINVFSLDVLEIMASKVCLDVLTTLGNAFNEAVKAENAVKKDEDMASCVVKNMTGLSLALTLDKKFEVLNKNTSGIQTVILESNTSIPLLIIDDKVVGYASMLKNAQTIDEKKFLEVTVNHDGFEAIRQITLNHAESQYFGLPFSTNAGDKWGFVADINVSNGTKTVTLKSHVEIQNGFSVPIEVFYMRSTGNEIELCGIVEPNELFNIPLYALYTSSKELFFRPKEGYSVASESFCWKDLLNEPKMHKALHCPSRDAGYQPFLINVSGDIQQINFESTGKKTIGSTCYRLNLRPTVILRNHLPYTLHYTLEGTPDECCLPEGKSNELLTAEVNKSGFDIRIANYLDKDWWCRKTFDGSADELSVWTFAASTDRKHTLDLGVHTIFMNGSLIISIYCPFWMINKTGLLLTYKQGDDDSNFIYHPADKITPVLFSFKPKNFFAKKKACLKVHDSQWSDKFSVDVVGSSGKIMAKTKEGFIYEVGVQIRLSKSGLTKIVVFTPFYMLANNAPYDIECIENLAGCEWINIPSKNCIPFWPKGNSKKCNECVSRVKGTFEQSPVFSYMNNGDILLPLDNKFCGINVDCQIAESQVLITYSQYHNGDATVRLVNTSDCVMEYNQKAESNKEKLLPSETILFNWKNPLGKRELMWKCDGMKSPNFNPLMKDGIGEFTSSNVIVYWVSFLDGMQRVLMLTTDIALATVAQQAGELERADIELNLSLNSIGVSIVNNYTRKEILYIGIASSGVIWEGRKMKSQRFKALTNKEINAIELAHVRYQNEVQLGKSPKPRQTLEHKIEVDFGEMLMYKPNKRHIRRSFQNGFWAQYKSSPHRVQLHAKLNRLQIDNQMPDSVFPVVLAPVSPPKSVVADSVPKPFTEVSLIMRKAEHSTVQQFKYFKVLIQEFHVKMDQSLIDSLLDFISPDDPVEIDHEALYKEDMKIVDDDLKSLAAIQSAQGHRNFYDELHFSPLKIHVSFSVTGGSSSSNSSSMQSNFIGLLLKSVGVTVTEIQDVVFKLAFFERECKFMTQQKLVSEVATHYAGQAIKQMYVLVLGLDVIGNPFGLVLGITQGVEDLFYEPFQGAIQGPEEFAEGLALGVKSLFGHALGGAAGAASRITGTLGKGIAALTMDDDYQKKRREAMNRKPTNVRTGLAQSSKGLVMGVIDGVTGIVTKPIEGAKEDGVEGFFKGVGKGILGVVARPTAGAIDFASGSLDAIKKVTEVSDEPKKLRPTRFIQSDGIIRPYIRYQADGFKFLTEVEKGKYASTDCYVAHLTLTNDGKYILLVTDKRMILVSKGEIFGQWDCEWTYSWKELDGRPSITDKGFKFILKKKQKKQMSFFGKSDNGKLVAVKDLKSCEWIVKKINETMENSQ